MATRAKNKNRKSTQQNRWLNDFKFFTFSWRKEFKKNTGRCVRTGWTKRSENRSMHVFIVINSVDSEVLCIV